MWPTSANNRDPKQERRRQLRERCLKVLLLHYCNNFEFIPSSPAWKVCINIPGIKLVRRVWIFRGKKLNIYHCFPLRERRVMSDLILFYEIQNNHVELNSPKDMTLNTSRTRKLHSVTYKLLPARIDAHKNSFLCRTIPIWNSLPSDVIKSTSLTIFKERLNENILL